MLGSYSVHVVDMDADNDMDLVSTASADQKVMWHKNDGNGNFTHHLIASDIPWVLGGSAADFDRDGDMDVVVVSYELNQVIWYEATGVFR